MLIVKIPELLVSHWRIFYVMANLLSTNSRQIKKLIHASVWRFNFIQFSSRYKSKQRVKRVNWKHGQNSTMAYLPCAIKILPLLFWRSRSPDGLPWQQASCSAKFTQWVNKQQNTYGTMFLFHFIHTKLLF